MSHIGHSEILALHAGSFARPWFIAASSASSPEKPKQVRQFGSSPYWSGRSCDRLAKLACAAARTSHAMCFPSFEANVRLWSTCPASCCVLATRFTFCVFHIILLWHFVFFAGTLRRSTISFIKNYQNKFISSCDRRTSRRLKRLLPRAAIATAGVVDSVRPLWRSAGVITPSTLAWDSAARAVCFRLEAPLMLATWYRLHTHTHVCMCVYIYTYTCTYLCIPILLYTYIYVHIYFYVRVLIYIYIYICIYVYIYIHIICVYIFLYTHLNMHYIHLTYIYIYIYKYTYTCNFFFMFCWYAFFRFLFQGHFCRGSFCYT